MRSSRKTKRLITRLLLIALCAAAWFAVHTGRESPPATLAPVGAGAGDEPALLDDIFIPDEPALSESNTLPGVHQVIWEWSPTGLPGFEQESLHKKGIFRIDSQNLLKYEGSCTSDEIFSRPGGSASLPLDSRWIYKGPNRPQVRMKIRKNPATGVYEPFGGEVGFPSGVGMSYEADAQTGEQKTFLKLKKEF